MDASGTGGLLGAPGRNEMSPRALSFESRISMAFAGALYGNQRVQTPPAARGVVPSRRARS